MATVLEFNAALLPRGPFDLSASYETLNFVESGGSGYVCLQPCSGIPVTNTAYWFKFVHKGDPGTPFTYADLTAEQKAELAHDATIAAQAAQAAAEQAAQKFTAIKDAIDALDPSQSTSDAIVAEAAARSAKDAELESTLGQLGPKIDGKAGSFDSSSDADLAIGDAGGRVILQVKNGHIQTKHFDSSKGNARMLESGSPADFVVGDAEGYAILEVRKGHIKTRNFDSNIVRYVDCLGDSLTMGASWLGWFETRLQENLGDGYVVRNWGVGGETKSSIMARHGSASVILPVGFTLPANKTKVAIADASHHIKSAFDNGNVTLLLQGSTVDSEHTGKMANPCYIKGVECTLTLSNSTYYLERNEAGGRDIAISPCEPILFNTGRQMADAYISICWIGTNDSPSTEAECDKIIEAYKRILHALSNNRFIFVGLHKLSKSLGEYFEGGMRNEFGNKFFNIREYCCTNMIYDAGITPTAADLTNMENGVCPQSLLYDSTHFLPSSNSCIGQRLYEMCLNLGYLK